MTQVQGRDGRELPNVWQPGEIVPVCREFILVIPETDEDGYPTGNMVEERSVYSRATSGYSYIKALVGEGKIEHIGRDERLILSKDDSYPYGCGPQQQNTSSLFFQAVHFCFAEHHALALRPEVLMQIVLSQIAEVVKHNSDHYRNLFTTSEKKEIIRVRHDGLSRGFPSPWDEAIALFHPALCERIPSTIMGDMLCSFSTDTMEAQLARLISFMDAASKYYDYRVETRCGIPRVRMLGTPDDWVTLAQSVSNLSRFFGDKLERYFRELIPVVNKLAAQAVGEFKDEEFWSSLYKYRADSGTPTCNGWITSFVSFIQDNLQDGLIVKYPDDDTHDQRDQQSPWLLTPIPHSSVPSLISQTPFIWEYMGTNIPMQFLGGVLGVDLVDGCVTPALSYAVVEPPAVN